MKIIKTLTSFSVALFFINCSLIYSFDYSGRNPENKDAGIDSSEDQSNDSQCISTITCKSLKQSNFRYCGNFKDDCGMMQSCDCDPVVYETSCGGYGWYPDGGAYQSYDVDSGVGNPNRCGGGCNYEANPTGICNNPMYPVQWWCAQNETTKPPIDANCIMGKPMPSEIWCCEK